MRVIEVFEEPVRAIAVSPDGRFVAAASANRRLAVRHWVTGNPHDEIEAIGPLGQFTFTPDGAALILTEFGRLGWLDTRSSRAVDRVANGPFSGGVAVSPNGRIVVATQSGNRQEATLQQWELPSWRAKDRIEFWSPFERLAFSPNGEYIAGINRESFELRFANSFGLNRREKSREDQHIPQRLRRGVQREEQPRSAFFTFQRHSEIVVFGWDAKFRVMETRAGQLLKWVTSPGPPFADAAFVGSGRHLATVDGTGLVRMWSAESWEVVRVYDWAAGGLTCLTATADGLTGVCGTDTGNLVVFDVDE